MSLLDDITVLILTYNEEANIGRTLSALEPFKRVVVLDSASTDRTAEIVRSSPNARLVVRPFDQHATQWNYGLDSTGIDTCWVLALDADYLVSPSLVHEIAALQPDDATVGYRVGFRYCVYGRPLRGTLYPPHVVLFRRSCGRYVQNGHTQRLEVEGQIAELSVKIDHDDHKPLSRWLASQQRYAALEADHILTTPSGSLRGIDQIRKFGWPAPTLVLIYTLIWKRCILDGWPGWLYVLQRTLAETMIAIEVVDRRLHDKGSSFPD